MCDRPATSREHVPPRCFFPKVGDTRSGKDLRRNLISVPSCDEHNSAKSKDDEYLCFVVAFHFENNPTGAHSSAVKFLRAVKERQSLIHILKNPFSVIVNGQPTIGFHVDRRRVDRVFDHIARGLTFRHYGHKYTGKLKLLYPAMFDVTSAQRGEVNATSRQWLAESKAALAKADRHGENQDAFFYQVVDNSNDGRLLFRLTFFDGFIVDCLLTEAQFAIRSDA